MTTRNHIKIGVMKRYFQSTFGKRRTNPKITTSAGKYLCMERLINLVQDAVIYA